MPEKSLGFVGYGSLARVIDALETAVAGGGYIAGERFSAADVYVGSQIGFGLRFNTIEARPALVAYWQRIENRPAAVRARELDNAAMPAKEPAGKEEA